MATSIPDWLVDLGVEPFEGSVTNAGGREARGRRNQRDLSSGRQGLARARRVARDVSRFTSTARGCSVKPPAPRGVKTIVLSSTSGTIAVTEKGEVDSRRDFSPPLEIISRWPYYTSKSYQEMAALERFNGKGLRLVIMNPSLLLGPGDERLSSTKVVLDFMARKISAVPGGGLSFVDARDAAMAFRIAMKKGRHGERYLLGAANWNFERFFGRLERLTKISAPQTSAAFEADGHRVTNRGFHFQAVELCFSG